MGPRQYDSASSPRGVSEPPRRRRACAAGSASGSARRAAHWLGSTSLPALGAAVSVDAHLAVERGDESVRARRRRRERRPRGSPDLDQCEGQPPRGSPSEMLDKLLPPKLKKKPKKLQRQATFLDKPKESLKKRKCGRDFWELATFFLFVVIYGIYLGQTFENKSKYYISLYLENQLTGGEWHPKKYYGNTVTSEDWLSWASLLLVPATFPSENYLGKNFSQIKQQCGSKYSPDCAHAAPGFMADWGPIRVGKVRVRQLRMKMNAKCAIPLEFCPAGKVDDLCADQGKGCVGP